MRRVPCPSIPAVLTMIGALSWGEAVSPAVDSTHVDRIGSFCHISRVLPSCLVGDVQGSVDAHFATERRQHGTSF